MDIVSHCPFRVGTLVWQSQPLKWVLTVVCKATFLLRPGECPLAPEQESPIESDEHWNDDPNRSIRAVDELVPIKPRADVILLGYAYALEGNPVRSLVTRLVVGDVDKAIEVHNDRVVSPDGAVQEGGPFVRQQLVYERAAGGPGTSNPAGVRVDARDVYGRRTLPNIVPPGTHVVDMNSSIEPTGFGPIAATWPTRLEKLGAHAKRFPPGAHREWAVPDGIDFGHFNQAPRNQQIAELHESERIILENLHPEHPRLVTRLPGLKPAVFVTRPCSPSPARIAMRADTLCIDTERALVTLVSRGQVSLERHDEPIRIAVLMESLRHEVSIADAERAFGDGAGAPAHTQNLATSDVDDDPMQGTLQLPQQHAEAPKTALPFAAPATLPQPPRAPASPSLGGALPFQAHEARPMPPHGLAASRPPTSAPDFRAVAAPPLSSAQPPPPPTWAPSQRSAPVAQSNAPVSPWTAAAGTDDIPQRETIGMAAAAAPTVAVTLPNVAAAIRGGPAAASDAAAGAAPWSASKAASTRTSLQSPSTASVGDAITLLWYDPECVPRIRRHPKWRPILDELEKKPTDRELDDPTLAKDPADAEDRREIFEIIAHGAQTDGRGVEEAFVAAIRTDGKLVPPLVLVAGEIETPFDELAHLRATISTAVPLVTPADEGLKAALSIAKEFLATPDLAAVPGVCEGLAMRIREAVHREKKTLSQDHFDTQIERFLLAGRHYQRRDVFGDAHVRVLIWMPGEANGLVGYLPASLAKKLPMWKRFKVRAIAEVHQAQDQYETQARAMHVLALGRIGGQRL